MPPSFKKAAFFFASHRYADSLAQINALSQSPERTPNEKAFLARQADLCRKAMGQAVSPSVSRAAPTRAASSVLPSDCGPRALLIVCRDVFHSSADLPALSRIAGTTQAGTNLAGMERAAASCGLRAEGVQMDKNALANLSCPALAWVDGNHYVAVLSVSGDHSLIHDPNKSEQEEIPITTLLARSGGVLLVLTPFKPKPL